MEFRILGPLEVLHDGEAMRLPGRVQPRLLAVLLLEAGRVVPLGRIVDAVWDADPPDTARRQVQNNTAMLRRLLGDGATMESVGEGYRVRVDENQLDALRFEATVRTAREQNRAGDSKAALATLQTGLELWRGPALAGLSGRLIESGAARLDEARVAAIEERVDLQLEAGRTHAVIAELRELLARHPFRERLAGQLMLALYRDGRAPEALDVYETVRTRLVQELGMDPGQRLRDLHGAILREDAVLDTSRPRRDRRSAGAGGGPAMPAPKQLPADTASFTGREAQLSTLDQLLETGESAAVLSAVAGIGGVGKTALAVHWGHRVRERFRDGQLYVNLRGFDSGEPLSVKAALNSFLRALGQSGDAIPETVDEAAGLYRSLLAGKRILVVLDNARDVAQVRPLLPGSPGSFALVTSRNRLAGLSALDDAHPLPLDTLGQADCLELLADLLGADRLHVDPAAAKRLAELCGRLPLAMRIAAANLAAETHTSVADFVAELERTDRLELLAVDGDPDSAVATAFDRSYRALDSATQDLFLRLGLVPGYDFAPALAAAIADRPEPHTRRLLDGLENAHLVEQHQPGRYRYHDLIREYARKSAEAALNDSDRGTVRDRAVDWYFAQRNNLSSWEYDNVVAAFQTWRRHPPALRLVRTLAMFADEGHDVAEVRRHVDAGLDVARQSDDADGLYHVSRALTIINYHAGDFSSAIEHGRKVVELAPPDDSAVRTNLGGFLWAAGQYAEAETWLREALRVVESADKKEHLVTVLSNLGSVCHGLSKFDEAETHLKRSIRTADELSKTSSQTRNRVTLFRLYLDMARLDDAHLLLEEVKRTPDSSGSDRKQIYVLLLQGQLHRRTGQFTSGRLALTQALELVRERGRHGLAREIQDALAQLLSDSGQHRPALDCLNTPAGDRHHLLPRDAARRALIRCEIHARLGECGQAVSWGLQALDLYAAMPDPLQHARGLEALADAHAGLGDVHAAGDCRRRALEIFTRLDAPDAKQLQALLKTV